MTNQEIFNNVYIGLASQNWRKSWGEYVSNISGRKIVGCVYRGPNGMKCAAGHLIPDDIYNPTMEGQTFDPVWLDMTKEQGGFVRRLQFIHDDEVETTPMKDRFEKFAAEENLSIPN